MAAGLTWRQVLPSLPLLDWGRRYDRATFAGDALAALIVTLMLIPQSLAYALLAGLPPEVGLYASVAPLLLYAVFGTSRALAVGPVAVVSLMTAAAIGQLAAAGTPAYWAALTLAFLSGAMLLAMGLLRLGFLANFLSHPVISGFITASALLITASQLKTLLGVRPDGHTLPDLLLAAGRQLPHTHVPTLLASACATAFLFWVRKGLKPLLVRLGLAARTADMLTKAGPVAAIAVTTGLAWAFGWQAQGMKVVGAHPAGPAAVHPAAVGPGAVAAAGGAGAADQRGGLRRIGVGGPDAGGQAAPAHRTRPGAGGPGRQQPVGRVHRRPAGDRRLLALGGQLRRRCADAGGRRVHRHGHPAGHAAADAGAGPSCRRPRWPPPSWWPCCRWWTSASCKRTWAYSKPDFIAVAATLVATLGLGVETGLVVGVSVSLALFLHRTSRPHIATVGLVPGTEHFRNVQRHAVQLDPAILSLRVDESLYFANARALEDHVNDAMAAQPGLRHVVLQCSAINAIDASALESLESIAHRLRMPGCSCTCPK
jgi:SulP family sulfate permease